MRAVLFALLSCFFSLSVASPAFALSCAVPVVNQASIDAAAAIFEGVVVAEKKTVAVTFPGSKSPADNAVLYVFRVTRNWKGTEPDTTIEIIRNTYWGDSFTVGQAYLVFAHAQEDTMAPLATPLCGLTTPLEYGGDTQKALAAHFAAPDAGDKPE